MSRESVSAAIDKARVVYTGEEDADDETGAGEPPPEDIGGGDDGGDGEADEAVLRECALLDQSDTDNGVRLKKHFGADLAVVASDNTAGGDWAHWTGTHWDVPAGLARAIGTAQRVGRRIALEIPYLRLSKAEEKLLASAQALSEDDKSEAAKHVRAAAEAAEKGLKGRRAQRWRFAITSKNAARIRSMMDMAAVHLRRSAAEFNADARLFACETNTIKLVVEDDAGEDDAAAVLHAAAQGLVRAARDADAPVQLAGRRGDRGAQLQDLALEILHLGLARLVSCQERSRLGPGVDQGLLCVGQVLGQVRNKLVLGGIQGSQLHGGLNRLRSVRPRTGRGIWARMGSAQPLHLRSAVVDRGVVAGVRGVVRLQDGVEGLRVLLMGHRLGSVLGLRGIERVRLLEVGGRLVGLEPAHAAPADGEAAEGDAQDPDEAHLEGHWSPPGSCSSGLRWARTVPPTSKVARDTSTTPTPC